MSFGPSVRNGLGIGLGPTATLATAFSQATLDFDFIDNQVFPTDITFTRASSATMFDSSGTLIFAPMNAIRNNTMVGAVTGTPGTLPTNWAVATSQSLTTDVVAVGTSGGINYIDLRISGTPAGSPYVFSFEAINVIAAAAGQTWTESAWFALVGGSLTNVSAIQLRMRTYTSGVTFIAQSDSAALSVTSTLTRFSHNYASLPATTAFIEPALRIGLTAGQAVDFTLRIGMPQLQLGPTATAVNATSGTAYQAPRLDYDPATLAARGLLIEEQRTNSIRNNTMQGAVAGTPGTLPTNWVVSGLGTLTQQVVGTGTVNGITYIDLRFSGTTSTTQMSVRFEPSNVVAATNGQTWTGSSWCAVTAGSLTNITGNGFNANIYDAASVYLTSIFLGGINTTSTLTRTTHSGTIASATAAFIQPQIYLLFSSGVAIDITLRIGLPQLELGAFATSVIPTTTAAATRSADVASVNTLSPWYNASAGTLYAEYSIPSALPAASNPTFASLVGTGGVGTNAIAAYINTPSGKNGSFNVWSSGSVVGRIDVSSNFVAGSVVKYAAAFAANDRAVTSGGFTPTTSSTAYTIPTVSSMTLGSDPTLAAINGYLRRITYYPSRLSNAQLQALTA